MKEGVKIDLPGRVHEGNHQELLQCPPAVVLQLLEESAVKWYQNFPHLSELQWDGRRCTRLQPWVCVWGYSGLSVYNKWGFFSESPSALIICLHFLLLDPVTRINSLFSLEYTSV